MSENDNSHSLILRPSVLLVSVTPGSKRILSGMVAETLALSRTYPANGIDKSGLLELRESMQEQAKTAEQSKAHEVG